MPRLLTVCFVLCATSPVFAQAPDSIRRPASLDTVVVTATRTERSIFDAPQPVTVLDRRLFRERLPNGVADLFRDFPGLDASGVGPNQRRPEIRGLRGQRILVLQDGLRLNNSRRQQDFGEIPAVAGADIERVEIVRGPSSVLYGSDAIGGVVNIISRAPSEQRSTVAGELQYRYGSAGEASTPSGSISGSVGRFSVRAAATFRDSDPYRAPAGTFGDITLDEKTLVNDTGIRDESYDVASSFRLNGSSEVFARSGWYKAENAGFGFIDPAVFGPGQTRVQILYPDQSFARHSLGFRSRAVSSIFADRIEISAYSQQNERTLDNKILVPAGPRATIDISTWNFTDLSTIGGRVEAARTINSGTTFTYGLDAFRDNSRNTDSSRTVITGFGPTMTQVTRTPQIPNATFASAGVFAQIEATPVERLSTVLGARYQTVTSKTRATDGIDRPTQRGEDATIVWNANGLYRIAENLNLVMTLGRGFRAANIVERFFDGPAPEGNGFQRANPDLDPETSLNADLGLRFRTGMFHAEAFAFRNDIRDAIRTVATGDSVSGQPAFTNRNLERLRITGLEGNAGMSISSGFNFNLSFTALDGDNISNPAIPVGDSYTSKVTGDVGYRAPGGRFTAGYTVRHQGEQKEAIVGTNPLGPVIPSFTVHSARASVVIFKRRELTNELALNIDNIGNKLYAEFPNAGFFRPEPGRNVSVSMLVRF